MKDSLCDLVRRRRDHGDPGPLIPEESEAPESELEESWLIPRAQSSIKTVSPSSKSGVSMPGCGEGSTVEGREGDADEE